MFKKVVVSTGCTITVDHAFSREMAQDWIGYASATDSSWVGVLEKRHRHWFKSQPSMQWWANPNPDLDLTPDLTNFPNPTGFGFALKMFRSMDLDLSFFKVVDLNFFGRVDLHLDLKIGLDLDLRLLGFARLCFHE